MKYMGHDVQGDFNYCCGSNKVDDFSIFANIIAEDEENVTLERFQKFGKLKLRDTTFSRKDFEMYYQKIEPDKEQMRALRQNKGEIER